MTNQELIKKADMAVADLATGGKLNPEQANTFIRKLYVAAPTIIRESRLVTMNSHTRNVDKIGFATRILRPAVEGTALSVGDRSKPTTEQVVLTTKEVIAEVRISYSAIEDNIERGAINANNPSRDPVVASGGIKDTIVSMITDRVGKDLEELLILGDTGSGDTYLALLDGLLVQATSNVVDNASAGVSKAMFKAGLQTMPDQYLQNLPSMRHYLSFDNVIEYRDQLGGRETALGDSLIQGTGPIFGFGVPVSPVTRLSAGNGLLVNPQNIIFGVQRDISIEADKNISARQFILVVTLRVDFKYEEEEAVVKYTNVA